MRIHSDLISFPQVWRRRVMIAKGSQLIAFNEVTKRAHATFDMSQALRVEDCSGGATAAPMAATFSKASAHRRTLSDEDEEPYANVEHSFRIIFKDETVIYFYADSDKAKTEWLGVLSKMAGKQSTIPPLWAVVMQETMSSQGRVRFSADSSTSLATTARGEKPARPASQAPSRSGSRNPVPTLEN